MSYCHNCQMNKTSSDAVETDFQNGLSLVTDGHTMVCTQANNPHDNPLTINNYQLATLLENIHLQAGHQVAQQLTSFHTVRHHPVTLLYPADGQRKRHLVGIERSNIGIFRYVNSTFSHLNLTVSSKIYVPSSGTTIRFEGIDITFRWA